MIRRVNRKAAQSSSVQEDKLSSKIVSYLQNNGFRAFAMRDLESEQSFTAAMGNGYIRLIEVSGMELGQDTKPSKFDALRRSIRRITTSPGRSGG